MFILGTGMVRYVAPSNGPIQGHSMDVLAVFGFLTAIVTLIFWMHRDLYRWSRAMLAVCLLGLATYACLEGAWPVGVVEGIWAGTNLRQWWGNKKPVGIKGASGRTIRLNSINRWKSESRVSRLFEV